MKKFKIALSLVLALCLLLAAFPMAVFAVEPASQNASGSSGACTWEYTAADKTITISSTDGVVPGWLKNTLNDYDYNTIVVSEGITTLSESSLRETKAKEIILPDSITTIYDKSFMKCANLEYLVIPEGVTYIGNQIVDSANSLKAIYFPRSLTNGTVCGNFNYHMVSTATVYFQPGTTGNHVMNATIWSAYWNKKEFANIRVKKADGSNVFGVYDEIKDDLASGDTVYPIIDLTVTTANLPAEGVKFADNGKNVGLIDSKGNIKRVINVLDKTMTLSLIDPEGSTVLVYNTAGFTSSAGYDYKKLIITEGVTELGDDEYNGCFNSCEFEEVVLPRSLRRIGNYAFKRCANLKYLHIPYGVTEVGTCAIFGANSLETLYIPPTVTTITNMLFYQYEGMSTLNAYAFHYYNWDTNNPVNLALNGVSHQSRACALIVKADGTRVYGMIENIASQLTSGETMQLLYDYTPSSTITVPNGATLECPDGAIGGTGKVTLGGKQAKVISNTQIPLNVFTNADASESVVDGHYVYAATGKREGTINDTTLNYSYDIETKVLTISGSGAMKNYDSTNTETRPWQGFKDEVEAIVIKSGVTSIGSCAFRNMSGVKTISIPNTVNTLGFRCLSGTSIKVLNLPSSINSFNTTLFSSSVELLTYTGNPSSTHPDMFADCNKDNIIVYATANNVRAYATGIKHLANTTGSCGDNVNWYYGNNILSLYGNGAMADYTAESKPTYSDKEFNEIFIRGNIEHIGAYAFAGMGGFNKVSIPESVTSIGANAFAGCEDLQVVELPCRDVEISENAFDNGVAIIYPDSETNGNITENITWNFDLLSGKLTLTGTGAVPDYTSSAAPWANYKSVITDVEVGYGITAIGANTFKDCTSLKNVSLRTSLTSIGANAFACCTALLKIDVPKTVVSIGAGAFENTTVISCYADSYAESYATANGLTKKNPKSMKVLAIGNSYTMNSYQYIYDIAKKAGVEDITLGRVMYGGRRLIEHLAATQGDMEFSETGDYVYWEITNKSGTWATQNDRSIYYALQQQDWDIIVMQGYYDEVITGLNTETSTSAGAINLTTDNVLNKLIAYVKSHNTNPDVKLGWFGVWARWANYGNVDNVTSYDVYRQIMGVIDNDITGNTDIDYFIPVGTAIENLRNTFLTNLTTNYEGFDYPDFNGDHTHMGILGQYIAGLTWVKALTGLSIDNIVPGDLANNTNVTSNLAVFANGVNAAIANPYDTSIAKIRNTYYHTLADAIDAAVDGDTVTLIGNCAEELAYDKYITVNVGKYTLSGTVFTDFNNDGITDLIDLVHLKKHLANNNVPITTAMSDKEQSLDSNTLTSLVKVLLGVVSVHHNQESRILTTSSSSAQRTEALKSYLEEINGEYTLAGQEFQVSKNPEIAYIYQTTGKLPALMGFDMNGAEKTTDNTVAITAAMDWYKKSNGIVSLMWHWQVPKDVTDLSQGYSVYSCAPLHLDGTTFNLHNAVTSGTAENTYILNDIDAMAYQLKKFKDAGIPVLWRPLHEASGRHFWWGTSADDYKALWSIMYDRLTNYHGLDNLIWIWNGQDSDWMPSTDTFDIAGYDNYSTGDAIRSDLYNDMKSYTGGKMLALTEVDSMPSDSQMTSTGARWLYWCTWYGDFAFSTKNGVLSDSTYNSEAQYKENYLSENVITLDELPLLALGNKRAVPEVIKTIKENGSAFGENPQWVNDSIKLEFEFGELTADNPEYCKIINGDSCSGFGCVHWQGYQTPSSVMVNVDVPDGKQGTYTAKIYYYNPFTADKANKLNVNGIPTDWLYFKESQHNDIRNVSVDIELKAGTNTLGFTSDDEGHGWVRLDCIVLTKKS